MRRETQIVITPAPPRWDASSKHNKTRRWAAAWPRSPLAGVLPHDATNDDASDDSKVNDGCPAINDPESGAECDNTTNDDVDDPLPNDGCPQAGSLSESFVPDPQGCDTDTHEASCTFRGNPADGDYTFTTYVVSQRDADDDGFENSLDVCVDIANSSWNPYAPDPAGDTDSDGLPNDCDPAPTTPSPASSQVCPSGNTGPDEDGDCLSNRQDNCPLVNGDDLSPAVTNGADTDGDGIGDACDDDPETVDGARVAGCISIPVTIGSGGTGVLVEGTFTADINCAFAGEVTDAGGGDGGGDNGGTNGGGGGTNGGTGTNDASGGPSGGVGALAPAVSTIPTWGAIASALGGAGFLAGLGTFISRILRRRR